MAVNRDITVDQGANYVKHVQITDGTGALINLVTENYTGRLQIKRSYKDNAPIILNCTTENGKLVLHDGGVIGRISLKLTEADTAELIIQGKILDCVYDWELIDDGSPQIVRRIYEGDFTITKNLTI